MKNLKVTLAAMMFALFFVLGSNDVKAQSQQGTTVGQAVAGLINVNVGAVAVNVGDITLEDLVDVGDVLSGFEITALNNVLNNSPIASYNSEILTNLLRDAELITENQIVVGVLSGGSFLIQ